MDAVLFPLPGLILSPGGKITLNIFEPRYLKMVNDAVASDIPMAIAHASKTQFSTSVGIPDEGYPFICQDVGYGEVEVIGESPKGVLIAVNSQGKAHVTRVEDEANPYIKLELEPINQNYQLQPQSEFLYRRIRSLTRERMQKFLKTDAELEVVMAQLSDPEKLLAFYIDHILQGGGNKYKLFQLDDINDKLAVLGQMIVGQQKSLH